MLQRLQYAKACGMLAPKSLAEPGVAAALERAIVHLRYGTISVNYWLGYPYYFGLSPWGGAPGSTIDDIQSGIGMVNNVLMLDGVEKTVYTAPFHKRIDPYIVRSRRIVDFGRKLAAFDGTGAWGRLLSLVWTSMRC